MRVVFGWDLVVQVWVCFLAVFLKAMLSVYIALAIGGSLRGVGRSGAVLGNLFIQRWKKGTPSSERILS